MTKDFFIINRNNYINKVINNSISIFFSGRAYQKSADQEFDFEVDKNFFYLTGINQANVIFTIIKKDDITKEVLFIEKNDEVLSKWVGLKLTIEQAQGISGIDTVQYIDTFNSFLYSQLNPTRSTTNRLKNVYLNLERRNTEGYTNEALEFVSFLNQKYPDVSILNAFEIVINLRMFKSEEEIDYLKQSINTTKNGIETMMKMIKPGLFEYQLESYFDWYIKYHGQKDTGFKTICASGKNATILHYVDNNQILKENDLVLLDLGARTNFYNSDITRCLPVNGLFTKRQKEVYNEVLNVNKLGIEFLEVGVTLAEFNKYVKGLLIESAKKLGLIKEDQEIEKYYYHSAGHFLGLDTHDPGLSELTLQEGMVITCEPGLYIDEEEIGIRIEDDVLITKDGPVNLSKDIIKEIEDIEKFMAANK